MALLPKVLLAVLELDLYTYLLAKLTLFHFNGIIEYSNLISDWLNIEGCGSVKSGGNEANFMNSWTGCH